MLNYHIGDGLHILAYRRKSKALADFELFMRWFDLHRVENQKGSELCEGNLRQGGQLGTPSAGVGPVTSYFSWLGCCSFKNSSHVCCSILLLYWVWVWEWVVIVVIAESVFGQTHQMLCQTYHLVLFRRVEFFNSCHCLYYNSNLSPPAKR